jgi:Zn-dependent peptidase ImmA (M78 family)
MARRLPKVIRLLTQKVEVIAIADLSMADAEDETHVHDLYGLFEPQTLRIFLDKDQAADRMRETFAHECIHAMLNVAHMEFEEEEEVVKRLAPVLLAFLRENRGPIAYLQERT